MRFRVRGGLKEAGIEIPYRQHDLHIRSAVPVTVKDEGRTRSRHAKPG